MYHLLRKEHHSWSGRERNCAFLNCGGSRFADVSAISGLDFADDGRALAVVDWDQDGNLDLWFHNRTAPRLRLMLNQTDSKASTRSNPSLKTTGTTNKFLAFKLRGTTCNRDAIGARVHLRLKGETTDRVQTLYAGDGFLSQSSKWIHFGLGADPQIERVTVRWPGGRTEDKEQFSGAQPGKRYLLVQGSGRVTDWKKTRRKTEVAPSTQKLPDGTLNAHVFLAAPLTLPTLRYALLDDEAPREIKVQTSALLVNFWASWCLPCVAELKSFTARERELRQAGLDVLALTVDGVNRDYETTPTDAKRIVKQIKFPFQTGAAMTETLDKFMLVQELLLDRRPSFGVPLSFLVDDEGGLVAIYRGPIRVDTLLRDMANLSDAPVERSTKSVPLEGRWIQQPREASLGWVAGKFAEAGYAKDAQRYLVLSVEQLRGLRHRTGLNEQQKTRIDTTLAGTLLKLGKLLQEAGSSEDAIRYLRDAVRIRPDNATILQSLAAAYASVGRYGKASETARKALSMARAQRNVQSIREIRSQLQEYREATDEPQ